MTRRIITRKSYLPEDLCGPSTAQGSAELKLYALMRHYGLMNPFERGKALSDKKWAVSDKDEITAPFSGQPFTSSYRELAIALARQFIDGFDGPAVHRVGRRCGSGINGARLVHAVHVIRENPKRYNLGRLPTVQAACKALSRGVVPFKDEFKGQNWQTLAKKHSQTLRFLRAAMETERQLSATR